MKNTNPFSGATLCFATEKKKKIPEATNFSRLNPGRGGIDRSTDNEEEKNAAILLPTVLCAVLVLSIYFSFRSGSTPVSHPAPGGFITVSSGELAPVKRK